MIYFLLCLMNIWIKNKLSCTSINRGPAAIKSFGFGFWYETLVELIPDSLFLIVACMNYLSPSHTHTSHSLLLECFEDTMSVHCSSSPPWRSPPLPMTNTIFPVSSPSLVFTTTTCDHLLHGFILLSVTFNPAISLKVLSLLFDWTQREEPGLWQPQV